MAVSGSAAGVPLVLVTGVTGFIASHVVQQLLRKGEVRVRGTMRSLKDVAKVKVLKEMVPDARYQLELVEAELQNREAWQEAVKECEYVYHLASPFPLKIPRDEKEVIKPAVDGALNVLKACAESSTIKRVVLTSSIAAISAGLNAEAGRVYTEEDWAAEEDCAPYEKSKLKAERAAWDFMRQLGEEKNFDLVVVNPAVVIGPSVGPSKGASSGEVVRAIIANDIPALASVNFPLVDVRDVAAGHIAAMNNPNAAGNRYILYGRSLWAKEVAEIISKEFSPQGYKIKSWIIPKVGVWAAKFFFIQAKLVYPALGKEVLFQNAKMKSELGIYPMDLAQSIIDTCYSLIENGVVLKTRGYQGPSSANGDGSRLAVEAELKKQSGDTTDDEEKKDENKNCVEAASVLEQKEIHEIESRTPDAASGTTQNEEQEAKPKTAKDKMDQTDFKQIPTQPNEQANEEVLEDPPIAPVDCKDGIQAEESF